MKALYRAIENFCARHPRFGIPHLMLVIIAGNIISYFLMMADPSGAFFYNLQFSALLILKGEVWRLITWVFIPLDQGLIWFAISLYFYYVIGSTLERYWGKGRFTIYYLTGVLLHVLYGFIVHLAGMPTFSLLDAMYINMSLFLAYAVLNPDARILLFFFIPIKIWWLAAADLALFAFEVATLPLMSKLLPVLGLLNFFLFCWDGFIDMFRRIRIPRRNSARWHEEVRRAENPAPPPSFTKSAAASESFAERKCAVCGKKASEHPELEFRYCSKCEGLHCFCEEHIGTHVHFTA